MTTTVPFKTQLGHDELRARTLKLGQRHRTILFLVDGRRPLAEVLSLAQQAGAATHHFEELLRLGLLELPPDPTPPAPPPQPVVSDDAALTSVELVVPDDEDAVTTVRAPLTEVVVPDAPRFERALPPVLREVVMPDADSPRAGPPRAGPPRAMPPPVLDQVATPLPAIPAAPAPSLDIALPLPDAAEAQLLQRVRDLLIDTLRIDAPLFSARTFMRVRNAQSARELIDLVWEIQDHLSHKRHTRKELQSLQQARELLGLGNTLVNEDSRLDYIE